MSEHRAEIIFTSPADFEAMRIEFHPGSVSIKVAPGVWISALMPDAEVHAERTLNRLRMNLAFLTLSQDEP